MNTFQVFSSAIVKRPVVIFSFSHSLIRFWIAAAVDTDCANLAFERVYSWPGYAIINILHQRVGEGRKLLYLRGGCLGFYLMLYPFLWVCPVVNIRFRGFGGGRGVGPRRNDRCRR